MVAAIKTTIVVDTVVADILRRAEAHAQANGETLGSYLEHVFPQDIVTPLPTPRRPRPIGLAAGEFTVPDDFDAPLPDDILDAFEGKYKGIAEK